MSLICTLKINAPYSFFVCCGIKRGTVYFECVFSQVLLQPQFIKAESLLLTTLKHDPCMVTTVATPTSLATTTTPVQSTSLQVGALCAAQC